MTTSTRASSSSGEKRHGQDVVDAVVKGGQLGLQIAPARQGDAMAERQGDVSRQQRLIDPSSTRGAVPSWWSEVLIWYRRSLSLVAALAGGQNTIGHRAGR